MQKPPFKKDEPFIGSEDGVLLKQIQDTHAPDGSDFTVRPLLHIVDDILNPVMSQDVGIIEDYNKQTGVHAMIECYLSIYPWEAKLLLSLAALALNHGEIWLLAEVYSSNQLAASLAILKQVPEIMENSFYHKRQHDALTNLVKSIIDMTWCIIQFKELPSDYITKDEPPFSTAVAAIPFAVYWSIRSILLSATEITRLTSTGDEYYMPSAQEAELSLVANKISRGHDYFKQELSKCLDRIDEKFRREVETMLCGQVDNMDLLKRLIYRKDDILPLFDGRTKRTVTLDVLKSKDVLLLISDLHISQDELSILEQIYYETEYSKGSPAMVWMLIVDPSVRWTESMQRRLQNLQVEMPWYSVYRPSLIDPVVIRFVKERWHFRNKHIVVVLDSKGRELNPNARHMMYIWGTVAFPFTRKREEELWKGEQWTLELLVDGIDPKLINWMREGKHMFLYGGLDIDWIRKFTATANKVARDANISLEMVYVGKSLDSGRKKVEEIMQIINMEKLSSCWPDMAMIWFFWARVESMLLSKIQLEKRDDEDPVLQELKKIRDYDKNDVGWAILAKGSTLMESSDSWEPKADAAFKIFVDKSPVSSSSQPPADSE
ncbi:hypothetical protein RJ639_010728 [Escallonia herrerae]|uniref:Protein SIEVE ELEMENT OCCLUSION B-like n=1 Tax=Escallonia herrerae TaxID=1293975 RepID=A0AA88VMW1_9ASTE|nr:hypothetical protein RJ639_010728 [Escallonia herrerae]